MNQRTETGRTGDRPSWIRTGSVFVRAAHLLAASAVAGAFLLEVEDRLPRAWWLAAAVSGALLLAAEVVQHRDLHLELAGWSTLAKLLLLGSVAVAPGAAAPWLVSAAIVVATVGAHAPRRWRHLRLLGSRESRSGC